ncbi:Transposase (plasmid) [Bacillus cereus]|nr:Transposase [Bacillus cereus]
MSFIYSLKNSSDIYLQVSFKSKSFVKRKSKYDTRDLADLCVWISLHVAFLREIFTSLLTQKLCSNHSLSAHIISTFNRICILDARVFQLPGQFAIDYQGFYQYLTSSKIVDML